MYQVQSLLPTDARWPGFLRAQSRSHFSQAPAYLEFLEECYRYRPRCLGVFQGGALVGLLPAIERPRIVFGARAYLSSPFYEYGGWLTEPNLDGPAFVEGVRDAMKQRRVARWDVNFNGGCSTSINEQLKIVDSVECAELRLGASPEAILKTLGKAARKAVRRGQNSELVFFRRQSDQQILRFHDVFKGHMRRRFGTPPFSRDHFLLLQKHFGALAWLVEVQSDSGESLAYLYGIQQGKRIHLLHTVETEHNCESLRPADYAHWGLCLLAAEQGAEWIDFGFARYEGQRRFKKKWGCEFSQTHIYQLQADAAASHPSAFELPPDLGAKLQDVAAKLWMKLPPTGEEWLGHQIRRFLCR